MHHIGSASRGQLCDFAVYHGRRILAWIYVKNICAHLYWMILVLNLAMNVLCLMTFPSQELGRVIWPATRIRCAGGDLW
jgi:hypothetical protein